MTRTPISISGAATASGLLAAGALHVVWATGSTFPFGTREALNDTVIGRQVAPGPAECLAVAALLTTAAGAVVGAGRGHGPSRVAASGVGAVLAVRAALGFAGRTALAVPGSDSPRFTRMDRRVYAPICALLAAGAAASAR